jgi:O-antigen ligase
MRPRTISPRAGAVIEETVVGLLFFSLALSFGTRIVDHFALPKLLALRVSSLLLVLLWAWRAASGRVKNIPRPVLIAALVLGAWWILTTFTAAHLPTALDGIYGRYSGLWTHLVFLLLFLVFASLPTGRDRIERYLKLLIAALTPVSVYALVQFTGLDPLEWVMLHNRTASTVGQPVILAALLALALPVILAFLVRAGDLKNRLGWGLLFTLFLAAFFTTSSRGPLAGLVVSFIVFTVFILRGRREMVRKSLYMGLALAVVMILLTFAFYGGIVGRLGSSREVELRMMFWGIALEMVSDHPVTGVGLDNFHTVYPIYRRAEESRFMKDITPSMAHNGYLHTTATGGIPSLILYLALIGLVLVPLLKGRREGEGNESLLNTALAASLAGYLVQGLSGWTHIALTPFFWVLLGLAAAGRGNDGERTSPSPLLAAAAVIPVLFLVFLTVEGFSRLRADNLFWRAGNSDIAADSRWENTSVEIEKALGYAGDDHHYENSAAKLHTERFNVTRHPDAYRRSAGLFEASHRHNPFDPYVLIGRLDLETLALDTWAIDRPSPFAEAALERLLKLDANNPSAWLAAARLRLAAGEPDEARELAEKALSLRPRDKRIRGLLETVEKDSPP